MKEYLDSAGNTLVFLALFKPTLRLPTMTDTRDAQNFSRLLQTFRSPWIVSLVALVIRLAFLWIPPSRTHAFSLDYPPLGLEASNIAYSLAAHQGFASPFLWMSGPTGPTAWLTPVFPCMLSVIVRIFGAHTYASLLAILILNEFFSAATCLPLFYLATFRRKNEARSGRFAEDYQVISGPNVTFSLDIPNSLPNMYT